MKKVVLSIGIVVMFVAYSIVLRHQHSSNVTTSNLLAQTSGTGSTASSNNSSTSSMNSGSTTTTTTSTQYKDGTYTGDAENAFYGNVQVAVTVSGGKITDVSFLSYPNDNPNSQNINSQATPILKQEAIKAQSANVDVVSGATLTSNAFAQSLQSALNQAIS